MKKAILFLFVFLSLIMACEEAGSSSDEPGNTSPSVTLTAPPDTLLGKQWVTFTAEITDPDYGDSHVCIWEIDGTLQSELSHVLNYQLPDCSEETPLTVSVKVSDGEGVGTAQLQLIVGPSPWEPEAGWIYMLDCNDDIYASEKPTEELYSIRVKAYNMARVLYNRDQKPGYPFRVVVGPH